MRKLVLLLASVVLAVIPIGVAAAKSGSATVTVVHGLPGFTADIYVNDELVLDGFEAESITDPLELAAGAYDLDIRDVGAAPDSEPALSGSVTLEPGQNISIIAHLMEDGAPQLSVFENDVSKVAAGQSRVILRHTAQAPPANLEADDQVLLGDVGVSEEAVGELEAARHAIALSSAEDDSMLVGPTDLVFEEGAAYSLYLIGSSEDGSLDLMVQQIAGLHSAPADVPSGDGGLAATSGFPAWGLAVMVLAALGLAAAGLPRGRAR